MSVERKKYVDMVEYTRDTSELTIDEAAAFVEGQAVNLSPVDTGNLRGSIYRRTISDLEAEVGTSVDYAVYQEFGTRFQGAQPFLRPALDALRSRLTRIWSNNSRGTR